MTKFLRPEIILQLNFYNELGTFHASTLIEIRSFHNQRVRQIPINLHAHLQYHQRVTQVSVYKARRYNSIIKLGKCRYIAHNHPNVSLHRNPGSDQNLYAQLYTRFSN